MGAIIAKAYEKIGDTGSTVVEESQTLLDEIGELFFVCFVCYVYFVCCVYLINPKKNAFFIFVITNFQLFFSFFNFQSLRKVCRLIEASYLLTL